MHLLKPPPVITRPCSSSVTHESYFEDFCGRWLLCELCLTSFPAASYSTTPPTRSSHGTAFLFKYHMICGCHQALPSYKETFLSIFASAGFGWLVGFACDLFCCWFFWFFLIFIPLQPNRKIKNNCRAKPELVNPVG